MVETASVSSCRSPGEAVEDTLVLAAAMPGEVAALWLGAGCWPRPLRTGQWREVPGRRPGRVLIVRTGVGAETAGRAVATLLAREKVKAVVNLGYAGGLRPGLVAGDVVRARRFLCSENDVALPSALNERGPLPNESEQRVGYIGDFITVNKIAGTVAQKKSLHCSWGAIACEMEGWGVAQAAREADVPVYGIRAISDDPHRALPGPGLPTLGKGEGLRLRAEAGLALASLVREVRRLLSHTSG